LLARVLLPSASLPQKQQGELEQLELEKKRLSTEQVSYYQRELKQEKDARTRVAEDLKVSGWIVSMAFRRPPPAFFVSVRAGRCRES
jgi:hypothetical protein